MDKKVKILNQIKAEGYPNKEVAVSLEEFFIGNNDIGSIGPNLIPTIEPHYFFTVFKRIKLLNKTEDVFVRISDGDDTEWFYTDAVYIIGSWTKEELVELVKDLKPDEILEGWMYEKPVNIPDTKSKVYTLWWD